MILPDVNVLLHAHREDSPEHKPCRRWLEDLLESDTPFAVADLVLSSFLRIVTHSKVFNPPTPLKTAQAFVKQIREHPNAVIVSPKERHWDIFVKLVQEARCTGNLVPDAYFAALAIESGSTWVTLDQDYRRFKGLKWQGV